MSGRSVRVGAVLGLGVELGSPLRRRSISHSSLASSIYGERYGEDIRVWLSVLSCQWSALPARAVLAYVSSGRRGLTCLALRCGVTAPSSSSPS